MMLCDRVADPDSDSPDPDPKRKLSPDQDRIRATKCNSFAEKKVIRIVSPNLYPTLHKTRIRVRIRTVLKSDQDPKKYTGSGSKTRV